MLDNSPAQVEYLFRGQASGNVAATMLANDFDVACLRPYIGDCGRSFITVNEKIGGKVVENAVPIANLTATLRKDEWEIVDDVIIKVAKPRLKLFGDLRSKGLQYIVPDGMSKTVLQYQAQSDISPATISMDGMRVSESDRPIYDLINLPLPLIHKDISFPAREVMVSRARGNPLDMTSVELGARRCAEQAELLISGANTYQYGGGNIYGYSNFPYSISYTMTSPLAGGYTPVTTLNQVLEMKKKSQEHFHYGPWMLYFSLAWEDILDNDYKALGNMTLRQRLRMIEGISNVQTADYLNTAGLYRSAMVQESSDVARAVIGLDFIVVQWESHGGFQLNYKIVGIMVPQLRADHNNNSGIVYGATI